MKIGLFQGKSERETFLFAASILSPEGWWGGAGVEGRGTMLVLMSPLGTVIYLLWSCGSRGPRPTSF